MEQNGNVVASGQSGSTLTPGTYSPTLSLKGEGVRRMETMVVERAVLEGLVEEGVDSLLEWLKRKGAPEMVVKYFDSLFAMNGLLNRYTGDELPAMFNEEILRKVDSLKWGIMLFEGEWDKYAGREITSEELRIAKKELVFFEC